jgi:hypothetical protein
MRSTPIKYFGHELILICDGKCNKAWGHNSRPKRQLSENEDDYVYLADSELGEAPDDPGTYEGGHGKPTMSTHGYLNRWCCRECERSKMVKYVEEFELKNFSDPEPNLHSRRKKEKPSG